MDEAGVMPVAKRAIAHVKRRRAIFNTSTTGGEAKKADTTTATIPDTSPFIFICIGTYCSTAPTGLRFDLPLASQANKAYEIVPKLPVPHLWVGEKARVPGNHPPKGMDALVHES